MMGADPHRSALMQAGDALMLAVHNDDPAAARSAIARAAEALGGAGIVAASLPPEQAPIYLLALTMWACAQARDVHAHPS